MADMLCGLPCNFKTVSIRWVLLTLKFDRVHSYSYLAERYVPLHVPMLRPTSRADPMHDPRGGTNMNSVACHRDTGLTVCVKCYAVLPLFS